MFYIVDGKRLPLIITRFREDYIKKVLEKATVNKNVISFYFKNGIKIEKEFSNPAQGRRKKNKE